MKRNLAGKKFNGKEPCIHFNLEKGCRYGNSCKQAHICAYIPRGEKEPCGKEHSKVDHQRKN